MADNTTLATGSGGDTIATDDIGGVKYPRSKVVIGADGTNDGDVSATNPLPIKGTGTAGTANAGVLTVQGIASMTPFQIADNGGSITVDGTFWQATQPISVASVPSHDVTNAGTFAVQVSSIAAGDNNIGNVDIVTVPADPFGVNADAASATGSISAKLKFIASTGIPITGTVTVGTHAVTQSGTWTVDLGATDNGVLDAIAASLAGTLTVGSHAVTNAGTFAVQAAQSGTWNVGTVTTVTTVSTVTTVTTVTTVGTVTTLTGSGVAHDGADSGNPHKIGARAVTSVSAQTLVSANDRTDLFSGLDGVQITRPHCNLEDIVTGTATNTDGTSTECIAAQAAGIKTYLTSIILSNSSATACTVVIKDGTTAKVTIPVPAEGGAIFNPPVPLPGTAATAWNFDPSAATSTISCSMIGFKSKV